MLSNPRFLLLSNMRWAVRFHYVKTFIWWKGTRIRYATKIWVITSIRVLYYTGNNVHYTSNTVCTYTVNITVGTRITLKFFLYFLFMYVIVHTFLGKVWVHSVNNTARELRYVCTCNYRGWTYVVLAMLARGNVKHTGDRKQHEMYVSRVCGVGYTPFQV